MATKKNYTLVTGLWDIGRSSIQGSFNRSFEDWYLEKFKVLLKVEAPLLVFGPSEIEDFVFKYRSEENTKYQVVENVKNQYFEPFWDKLHKIRTDPAWYKQTSWLEESPQATLELYNPIVMSKMFMLHDAKLYNYFDSDYYYWIDAGLSSTVGERLLDTRVYDTVSRYLGNLFFFLSFPYDANQEVHGFKNEVLQQYVETDYVCRGGFFGGHREVLTDVNSEYYGTLGDTLDRGCLGTEECIFTIMAGRSPDRFVRYKLDGNGLIGKFYSEIINLCDQKLSSRNFRKKLLENVANPKIFSSDNTVSIYILTFNLSEQLAFFLERFSKSEDFISVTNKYIFDNSDKKGEIEKNKELAKKYGFYYLGDGKNHGITRGRMKIAEHFLSTDADYHIFFEDDMTLTNEEEFGDKFCRNGFRRHIPQLFSRAKKIVEKERYDFLKLSFTEVWVGNDTQTSFVNIGDEKRETYWPGIKYTSVLSRDTVPTVAFSKIGFVDDLAYLEGEVTYCNWPILMSRRCAKVLFLDPKWAHPHESTIMAHCFEKQRAGELKSAVLLASCTEHERKHIYPQEDRKEN